MKRVFAIAMLAVPAILVAGLATAAPRLVIGEQITNSS